jgi:hypothetical protein
MDFTLVFGGKSFPISRRMLVDFFEMNPSCFDDSSYVVQSPVACEHVAEFVSYLKSKQLTNITTDNAKDLCLLASDLELGISAWSVPGSLAIFGLLNRLSTHSPWSSEQICSVIRHYLNHFVEIFQHLYLILSFRAFSSLRALLQH